MKGRVSIPMIILAAMLLGGACAPVISKGLRDRVAKDITFKEVFQDPEAHKGKTLLWGGVIVDAKNLKEGTLMEVLQKPTDWEGRPEDTDHSEGRFLALYDGFLDVAIYAEGREVTVAGKLEGTRIKPLGEIEYAYPVMSVKEVHLWARRSKERLYPYPHWYYPYWWHHPSRWP